MLYTTKTLTRDGITITASFLEARSGYEATTALTLEAAGQVIDAFQGCPSHWTEGARDGWLCGKFPEMARLADEVYEKGREIHAQVAEAA